MVCVAVAVVATSSAAFAQPTVFRSPEAALEQGLGAFRGGYHELAIPALEYAAGKDSLIAKYYLAQIYSDNLSPLTDHVRAYKIYRDIVGRYSGIDPDVDPRAPLIGQAITSYARYVQRGLPEIGLKPNAYRAEAYFNNASMTFNNDDAQFELAKMYLSGEGVRRDYRLARHWLSTLTNKGHSGAQAFLADLLWRGKHVKADPVKALALIAVAVRNAPPQERLWIEDIYQTIYCGAPKGVRHQATGIVAEWGDRYGRKTRYENEVGRRMMYADARPVRTCQDGEAVRTMWLKRRPLRGNDNEAASPPPAGTDGGMPVAAHPQTLPGRFGLGGATGGAMPLPPAALGLNASPAQPSAAPLSHGFSQ